VNGHTVACDGWHHPQGQSGLVGQRPPEQRRTEADIQAGLVHPVLLLSGVSTTGIQVVMGKLCDLLDRD
jgi:hypothetical protein